MSTATTDTTLHSLADALLEAERTGAPIAPISATHPNLTAQDAYAIQSINITARGSEPTSARVIGHKIGLTSQAMQDMLGVNQPDYGVLYDDRVHPSGHLLDTSALIAPRVEPEFAFILGEDLSGPHVTAEMVRAATEYVVPALEVIDSRIRDWKIGLIDTIADNASCHCAILGTNDHDLADIDLATAAVEMAVNDTVLQTGVGAAVLGDPAEAVAWLANALHGYGTHLLAGHVVLSGSITAAVPFGPGDKVTASFGDLGSVEVTGK